MRFIVTTAAGYPGARLSKPGEWGNLPFPDVEAARAEAKRLGATAIEIETGKSRSRLTTPAD